MRPTQHISNFLPHRETNGDGLSPELRPVLADRTSQLRRAIIAGGGRLPEEIIADAGTTSSATSHDVANMAVQQSASVEQPHELPAEAQPDTATDSAREAVRRALGI